MKCSLVRNTLALFASLALLGSLPAEAQEQGQAQEPSQEQQAQAQLRTEADEVPAIWKTQDITFYFQSFSTFYSCSGLENKFQRALEALGVKAQVKVRSADCPASIARMPRVILTVTAPIEATPEALAEREKNRSTRELSARVQGKDPEEGWEQFPAKWKRVSLARQMELQPGDCEFVEELRRRVLPKLAVRVVAENLQCSPGTATLARPKLDVDTLVEVPPPDTAPDSGGESKPVQRSGD